MGDSYVVSPPTFDWNSSDLPTSFRNFKNHCRLMFDGPMAQSAKSGKIQVTYVLLWLGQQGINIFDTWNVTDTQRESCDEIFNLFAKHFEPKTNYRLSRFQLQRFRQMPSENVDEFITRCRIQGSQCKFNPTELEIRLIEQLIIGTSHTKVQQILLGKDETLKLDDALDVARTFEATRTHMEALNAPSISVDYVHKGRTKVHPGNTQKCVRCGLNYPHRGKCPAEGTNCNYCGKPNHWESVCRQKKRNGKGDHPKRRRGSFKPRKLQDERHVNGLTNAHVNQSDSRLNRGAENLCFDSVYIYNINGPQKIADNQAVVNLNIVIGDQPATLKAKVDTGAEGNVLPLRIFRQMYPHCIDKSGNPLPRSTKPIETMVMAYNDSIIRHFGTHTLPLDKLP